MKKAAQEALCEILKKASPLAQRVGSTSQNAKTEGSDEVDAECASH